MALESGGGVIDADAGYVCVGGERLRGVEAHAQDAAGGHPEISLGVENQGGGVGDDAEAAAGPDAERIVFSVGKASCNMTEIVRSLWCSWNCVWRFWASVVRQIARADLRRQQTERGSFMD